MKQWQDVLRKFDIMGEDKHTRSGEVISIWRDDVEFDLRHGFPAVTTKKLMWKAVVGEALWFLSGSTDIRDLKRYSEIDDDSWCIWTDDAERAGGVENTDLGPVYGAQWRDFGGVDQIAGIIESLKSDPHGRRHIVSAWNPGDMDKMALPPCHHMFECYVEQDEYLNLIWHQRSVDSFLGLPFNIASYALITHILAKLTGLKPGRLGGVLSNVHIYSQHTDPVDVVIGREPLDSPELVLPEFDSIDDLLNLTASDFVLSGYKSHGVVKGKLSVG